MNYELLAIVLLIAVLIAIPMIIEKNRTIKENRKEISLIKDYTTSRWGITNFQTIEWYQEKLEKSEKWSEKLQDIINEQESGFTKVLRTKEAYWKSLEEMYQDDQRLINKGGIDE